MNVFVEWRVVNESMDVVCYYFIGWYGDKQLGGYFLHGGDGRRYEVERSWSGQITNY